MTITIYNKSDGIKVVLYGATKYNFSIKVMGGDVLNLSFDHYEPIAFALGDYITYDTRKYKINQIPKEKKNSTKNFSYDCVFEGYMYELRKVPFMLLGENEFPLTANADTYIDLIITNLNAWFGSGWSKGTVIANTEYKTLSFDSENCLEALNRITKEFETEFYFVNKQLNLTTFGTDNGLTFQYGQYNALYDISRDNVSDKDIITRLYAYGGTKNLPSNYRGGKKRLTFDVGGVNYVEQNVSTYEKIGATIKWDEIYPRRTGTISAVNGSNVLEFTDSSMDFDLNDQLIPGTKVKLNFLTGLLSGYTFEVLTYVHATKTFTLIAMDEISIGAIPNTTFKPAINDKYSLIDLIMPDAYVTDAEDEVYDKAVAYLAQYSFIHSQLSCKCNPLYFKENAVTLNYGDYSTVYDVDLAINRLIRIVGYTLDLLLDGGYDITLADSIEPSISTRVIAQSLETQRVLVKTEIGDINRIRRNRKTIEELRTMTFDQDGYFLDGNIRPNSIETNMLAVGSKAGDFVLNGVLIEPMYTADKTKVNVSDGTLIHFSINDTLTVWNITGALTTGLTDGTAYYIYAKCNRTTTAATIVFDETQRKSDSDVTYYYFIVGVLHSVISGVRGISLTYGQTAINGRFIKTGRVSSADGNTYFDLDSGDIVGSITFSSGKTDTQLESEINNISTRNLIPNALVGAAGAYALTISTGQIDPFGGTNALKLVSVNDYAYHRHTFSIGDMLDAKDYTFGCWVKCKEGQSISIEFGSPYNGTTQRRTININSTWTFYNVVMPALNRTYKAFTGIDYIDNVGEVYIYQPTLVEGTVLTNTIKAIEDIDTGISVAQSTADSKNKNFTTTPTTPYKVGDSWMDGVILKKCKTERLTGAYNAADWELGTTYDRTQTVIDGGLTTGGTIQVANTETVNAGMTGNAKVEGSSIASPVRFWAGATFANREIAPFSVLENGDIVYNFPSTGNPSDPNSTDQLIISSKSIKYIPDGVSPNGFELRYNNDGTSELMLSVSGWKIRESSGEIIYGPEGSVFPPWAHVLARGAEAGIESQIQKIIDSSNNALLTFSTNKTEINTPIKVYDVDSGTLPASPYEGMLVFQSYSGARRMCWYNESAWRFANFT